MFKRTSFTRILCISYIVLLLIPVCILGGSIFYDAHSSIQKQKRQDIENLIKQNGIDIRNRMYQCENSLLYLTSNYSLQEFLGIDKEKYKEINEKAETIAPLVHNTVLSNAYCKGIHIYTDHVIAKPREMIFTADKVLDQEWYIRALQQDGTCWGLEDEKYYLTRKIITAYPVKELGLVRMEVKNTIFSESFQVFADTPVRIVITTDEQQEITYQSSKAVQEYIQISEDDLGDSGWKIRYEVGKEYFNNSAIDISRPVVMIIVVLLLAWTGIHFFARYLVRDLGILVEEVSSVKAGNLDTEIRESKIEELNVLADNLKTMLSEIRGLIQKVYLQEREHKSLELNLLKSKMNPHFLYNNLSTINWIALENNQPEISEITTELANFYRTALNKDKDIDRLSVELSNIKSYIRLQEMAHSNSFDVIYEVDEILLDQMVPCFILQPLVENAIEHGIDTLRDQRGLIKITVQRIKNGVYITVYDNGRELYQRIGDNELPYERFHYGTSNVHQRIQLICGSNSGLHIRADKTGTYSVIIIEN